MTLALAACNPGDAVEPDEAKHDEPTCLPAEVDTLEARLSPSTTGFGAALSTVRYSGMLNNNDASFMSIMVVGGASDSCTSSPCGYVSGGEVDVSTGELTGNRKELAPFTAGAFSAAVLGVDLMEPITDPSRGSFRHLAGGDEFLAGDPDPAGGPYSDVGRIHWFHVEYSGAFDAGEVSVFDKYRWVEGSDFSPAGLVSGADFGASLAAHRAPYGDQTDAVAVGAPGENAVYVLDVDPTWDSTVDPHEAEPFVDSLATLERITTADLTDCTPAAAISRFGASSLFHDLNGDGHPELIVGAPAAPGTSSGVGHVFVLKGLSSSPWVTATGCLSFINPNGGMNDEFGFSLAAGALRTGGDHDMLIAGSPGEVVDGFAEAGAFCKIALDDDDTSGNLVVDNAFISGGIECRSNPFPLQTGDVQRFGHALAVGNFMPLDRTGDDASDFATVEELAVGAPGGRPVRQVVKSSGEQVDGYTYENVAGAVDHGTVTVLRADNAGPLSFNAAHLAGTPSSAHHLAQFPAIPGVSGDSYGGGLATADLQRNGRHDLVIGAPDAVPGSRTTADGVLHVTRGTPSNGLQTGLSGIYTVTDAAMETLDARVLDFGLDGVSIAVEGFTMDVVDTTSSLCAIDDDGDGTDEFTGRVKFDLYSSLVPLDPAVHDSESNGYDLVLEIPAADAGVSGMTVSGKLWVVDTSPQDTIWYSLEEPEVDGSDPWTEDCAPTPSPNSLTFSSFATCEG